MHNHFIQPSVHGRYRRSQLVQQTGFSLLEVLIALLVLAVGLLGLAALQNMGLRLNHQSYERTQATILIYDMIDRMRVNPAGVVLGNYSLSMTGTPPTATQNCEASVCTTPAALAAYDMNRWISTVAGTASQRAALAGGQGSIASVAGSTSLFDISVQWQEQNMPVAIQQTLRVQLP